MTYFNDFNAHFTNFRSFGGDLFFACTLFHFPDFGRLTWACKLRQCAGYFPTALKKNKQTVDWSVLQFGAGRSMIRKQKRVQTGRKDGVLLNLNETSARSM